MIRRRDALDYHQQGRPGKIEVTPTKPVATQRDLSLAYSPGVAEPCREIHADPSTVGLYTARRNLVAVVTNGTAVLGLGDIGPLASKPVMEGKAVLFKRYADIDVFDIELNARDPDLFIEVVAAMEPTFGGINLEDIKAPDCFVIERKLRERLSIPVFHDDQHGTAIISAAAFENAAELQNKSLDSLRIVCIGAGAAAISCMNLWCSLGAKRENITLLDRHGVVRVDRPESMDEFRGAFARPAGEGRVTIADAIVGADVLIGLASAGLVTKEMVATMADRPIIFALANPDPEIPYDDALAARPDAIVGTGRSDYPNQVNNVLGFPYIFRGALDVGASCINEEMKLAAAKAIARLAREGVPDDVLEAYGGKSIRFGPEYVIPKPMDGRVLYWVAPAVAQAAMESGVASEQLDIEEYRDRLSRKLSPARRVMWAITNTARQAPQRIVFPEGEEEKIIRAAATAYEEGIARPILLGLPSVIEARAEELGVNLSGVIIVDRSDLPHLESYTERLWQSRARKGLTRAAAERLMLHSRTNYAMMMVYAGDAEGVVAGLTSRYPDTIRPALQIIGTRDGIRNAAGLYMVITKDDVKFLADTTININPDAETLAEIAIMSADTVQDLGIEPRVAMLSFSNFGDAPHESSRKVAEATRLVKARRPDLMVDGEMQADVALMEDAREPYPFCRLAGPANVLIFPNLDSGNVAYKLLAATGASEIIGPLVLGLRRPINVLQQGASVSNIVHLTAITAARAIRHGHLGLEPMKTGSPVPPSTPSKDAGPTRAKADSSGTIATR